MYNVTYTYSLLSCTGFLSLFFSSVHRVNLVNGGVMKVLQKQDHIVMLGMCTIIYHCETIVCEYYSHTVPRCYDVY